MNLVGGMLMGSGIGTAVGIALSVGGEEISQLGQGIKPTLKATLKSAALNLAFTVGGGVLGTYRFANAGGLVKDAEAEEGHLKGTVGIESRGGEEGISKADIGVASRESLPKGEFASGSTQALPKADTGIVANNQGLFQGDVGVASTQGGDGIQRADVGVAPKGVLRKTSRWAKPNRWEIRPATTAQKETRHIAFAEEDKVYDLSDPQYISDKFYEEQMDTLRERLRNAETQEEKDAIEEMRQDAIKMRKTTVSNRGEFRAQYAENVYLKKNKELLDLV
jgi:hypothetical protein